MSRATRKKKVIQQEIIHPDERRFYSSFAGKKYPKSFGKFFATTYCDITKELSQQYRVVCIQNSWKTTHFRYYNTMLRWLMENNASKESIEGVLDMAHIHRRLLLQQGIYGYYGSEDETFLDEYMLLKYQNWDDEWFDYSVIPPTNCKGKVFKFNYPPATLPSKIDDGRPPYTPPPFDPNADFDLFCDDF